MNGLVILGILVALFGNSAVIADAMTPNCRRPTWVMMLVWGMGALVASIAYDRIRPDYENNVPVNVALEPAEGGGA